MSKLKFFLSFFLSFLSFFLSAQDTIVITIGDTIPCKITKIDPTKIYFKMTIENEYKEMLLPIEYVANYNTKRPIEFKRTPVKKPIFRLFFDGGFSQRQANNMKGESLPLGYKEYYKDLNSGSQFSMGLQYFALQNIGMGFKFSQFRSKSAASLSYWDQNGDMKSYVQSEDINIDFIGPTINFRLMHNKNRNSLIGHVGFGYLYYLDRVLTYGINATGSTLGLAFGADYDFRIAENLAIGLGVSYIYGTLSKIELTDGLNTEKEELDNLLKLHHLDISIGLRLIR